MPITLKNVIAKLELPDGWSALDNYHTDDISIRDKLGQIVGRLTRKEIDDNLTQARVDEIVRRNANDGDAKISKVYEH